MGMEMRKWLMRLRGTGRMRRIKKKKKKKKRETDSEEDA